MSVAVMMEQEQLRDLPRLADLTDEELVTAHLDGRPGAFQHLYDRYRDRLVHFIIRKTGDADRAQDLVQEAFIRVTRHLHRFDTTKKFSTWVYTIASNLSKNELRNRSRSPLVLFQRLTNTLKVGVVGIGTEGLHRKASQIKEKRNGGGGSHTADGAVRQWGHQR